MISTFKRAVTKTPGILLKDAEINLFKSELEYSAPARGMWNIVHTGMLIPEAHQIFVCASSCLRGVVLTAAEMNLSHRFSTIEIRNNNILDGTMEDLIIEGTAEILSHLEKQPPVVLVYTSCIHHFTGCDTDYVFSELEKCFPNIKFVHCFMNPIMRKSGLTPDQLMRRQLYDALTPMEKRNDTVGIIGNDLPTSNTSELTEILKKSGRIINDITRCKSYGEYMKMAESSLNIVTYPAAKEAGKMLEEKLGTQFLYLPVSFNYGEIAEQTDKLCEALGEEYICHSDKIRLCEDTMAEIKSIDMEVAIDYTAVSRPFELAEYLVMRGINVTEIYADSVSAEDERAFWHLKEIAPQIMVYPTVHPKMCFKQNSFGKRILAIGQKAAYFTGTKHFVNIIENGGLWGYDAIIGIADEMKKAIDSEKDTQKLIQIKGWGCGCC